jgi:excisionase family DNA binding protein
MHDKLLTIKEAASELGVGEEELKRLTEEGKIPVYKVGGVFLRYDRNELDVAREFLRRERSAAPPVRRGPVLDEKPRFSDQLVDFLYFNDFYIISLIITGIILYIIFYT